MRLAISSFAILVLAFLVVPIVVIFPLSFSSGEILTLPTPGWSLQWYEDFFLNERWTRATLTTAPCPVASLVNRSSEAFATIVQPSAR